MGWLPVARKEYAEHVRHAWVLAMSGIFLALTLAASILAGSSATGVALAGMLPTILGMQATIGFVLPILALMLGFGTLAGERESGSLGLLAAQPVTRGEILWGKFAGLWAALATAVLAGIGAASLLVMVRRGVDGAGAWQLVMFVFLTLLWAATWMAIAVLVSALFRTRASAIGGALSVWFLFVVVWGVIEVLLLLAQFGTSALQTPQDLPPPWWLTLVEVLNPNSVYRDLLVTSLPGYRDFSSSLGAIVGAPGFTPLTFAVGMAVWIALPLGAAFAIFSKRDL